METSETSITVAAYGDWVVRVEACNDVGCGPHLARRFTVAAPPNRAPVVDAEAERYDDFVKSSLAPRGTLVNRPFSGIFTDPDGDALTYTVSVPDNRRDLVSILRFDEARTILFFEYDDEGDWSAVTPALPDPLVTEATVTATDPGGLSVSLTASFYYDWESQPVVESAVVGERAEEEDEGDGDGAEAADGQPATARSRASVSGATVDVTFDQDLQASPAPTPRQFTLDYAIADGVTGTIPVTGVSIKGRVLSLALASAPPQGQNLTLSYTHADATPVKRAAQGGDSVTAFSVTPSQTSATATADAGPDQEVSVDATVTLDASGSSSTRTDPTLTYAWTQTSGTAVTLSSATAEQPTFTAPPLPGDLVFSLTVNDGGDHSSAADTVTVTVRPLTARQLSTTATADAGPDQEVQTGATITLDASGSSSTRTNPVFTYRWKTISGSGGIPTTLATNTIVTFTAPSFRTDLVIQLEVFDESDKITPSAPDTMTVRVRPPLNPTTAPCEHPARGTTLGTGKFYTVTARTGSSLTLQAPSTAGAGFELHLCKPDGTRISLGNGLAPSSTVTASDLDSATTYWVASKRHQGGTDTWNDWSAESTTGGASIVDVKFTSSPAAGDTYKTGETIRAQVTWSKPVTVSTGGSDDNVSLRLDLGDDYDLTNNRRKMAWDGADSGTNTLTFEYTVVAADADSDGVWLQTASTSDDTIVFLEDGATLTGGDPATSNAGRTHAGSTLLPPLWTATLTVKRVSSTTVGCTVAFFNTSTLCSDFLTDDTLTLFGTNFQVQFVHYVPSDDRLSIRLTPKPPLQLALGVGNLTLSVGEAMLSSDGSTVRWDNVDLSWPVESEAELSLRYAAHGHARQVDGSVPAEVQSATLTSTPASGTTYQTGETIQAQVTWDRPVTVDTGGSNDNVVLRLDLGADGGDRMTNRRKMAYVSGSGTDTLTFEYRVEFGSSDADGVWLQTASASDDTVVFLENGATITGGDPVTTNAGRSLSGLPTSGNASHKVDAVITSGADAGRNQEVESGATVTLDGSRSVTFRSGATLTYAWTQTSGATVELSDATAQQPTFTAPSHRDELVFSLVVDDGGSNPSLPDEVTVTVRVSTLNPTTAPCPHPMAARDSLSATPQRVEVTGTTDSSVSYRATGSGRNALWFCRPDGTSEEVADGVSSSQTETVEGLDSGTTYWVTGGRITTFYTQWSDWQAVTTTGGASIVGVKFTSSPASGDVYKAGDAIRAQVTWSQPVTVANGGSNDNVFLRLDLGAEGGDQADNRRKMAYASGSGTDTLTFEYTVQAGDLDPDGVRLQIDGETVVFLENRAVIRGGNPASNAAAVDWPGLVVSVWSATLTVRRVSISIDGRERFGCAIGAGGNRECSSALTSDSFTSEGENYQVERIYSESGGGGDSRLVLAFNKAIPTTLILDADGRQVAVGRATLSDGDKKADWVIPSPLWRTGDLGRQVEVRLIDQQEQPSSHRVDGIRYIDYDTDDDGLIEIKSADQLSALRFDGDGDGAVDSTADQASYGLAFPNPVPGMGCPDGDDADSDPDPCRGYEIGAAPTSTALDIDLDTAPWNQGEGWVPIPSYDAILEGNGNTVSGLFINKSNNNAGLFHTLAENARVRNLGLPGVDITGAGSIGALAATNRGLVAASYSTGQINGFSASGGSVSTVGGLVGLNDGGKIHASYSSAELTLNTAGAISAIGGLVGRTEGGEVHASYATGSIILADGYGSAQRLGGLVGYASTSATINASYATGPVLSEDDGEPSDTGGLVGDLSGSTVTASYYDTVTTGRIDPLDWSTTLTVRDLGIGSYGCTNDTPDSSHKCSSAFTPASFAFEGETYQVETLAENTFSSEIRRVNFQLDKIIPTTFALRIDGREFLVSSAVISNSGKTATWDIDISSSLWSSTDVGREVAVGLVWRVEARTSDELGSPRDYTGIYAGWDLDLDDADEDDDLSTGGDDPWDFGTAKQYPAIDYLELTPAKQARLFPTASASAGENQEVPSGALVTLLGSAESTLGNRSFTYRWTQISGAAVELSDDTARRPTFRAPLVSERLSMTFALVAHDGTYPSPPDTVKVTVVPAPRRDGQSSVSHMGWYRTEYGCTGSPITVIDFRVLNGGVAIEWENPGVSSITRYQFQVQHGNGFTIGVDDWTDIPGSDANTTYAAVYQGLSNGRLSTVLLRALAGGRPLCFNELVWVTPSETTLDAPTGLRAEEADPTAGGVKVYEPTGRSDQLTLSWDDVSGDLPDYDVQYKGGRNFAEWTSLTTGSTPSVGAVARSGDRIEVTVSGLYCGYWDGYPYSFRVRAKTADGSIGPNSNLVRNVYPDRFGTEGDDTPDLRVVTGSWVCYGGLGGGDVLDGNTNRPNVIHGGDGNDSITGGDRDDKLYGGPGDDHVIGHQGNDFLNGEDGDDTLEGREGNDTLVGDAGNDTLNGGPGNDDLRGYEGDDTLDGGPGNDKLFGGAGHNIYISSEGADEFDSSGGIGTADYSASPAAVSVRTDGAYGNWPTGGHATGDRLIGVENVIGSDHDDVLRGYTHPNHFKGGKGNDRITGGRGDDTLEGGAGNDTITGLAGNDGLHGGDGNDLLKGGPGVDGLYGGAGDDTLEGGSGHDTLDGEDGDDTLEGGAGADTLDGGPGTDTLSYATSNAGVTVSLYDGVSGKGGHAQGELAYGFENLIGSPHDDTIAGNGLDNVIRGRAGNDHLFGWHGDDTLYGNAGNDHLYGLDGDDHLYGGGGLDRFYFTPGFGDDTIHDYVLGASRAEGEQIHLCMGGRRVRPTYSAAPSGADTVITVRFDGEDSTIRLIGISAAKADLNVVISPISGENCAGLLKLSDEFPDEDRLLWSATLTVRDLGTNSYGCADFAPTTSGYCSNALSSDSFTFEAENYQVQDLYGFAAGSVGTTVLYELIFSLDKAIPTALILQADGQQFAVDSASISDGGKSASWSTQLPLWFSPSDVGRQVPVELWGPPPYP